jgi:hypothetical protein
MGSRSRPECGIRLFGEYRRRCLQLLLHRLFAIPYWVLFTSSAAGAAGYLILAAILKLMTLLSAEETAKVKFIGLPEDTNDSAGPEKKQGRLVLMAATHSGFTALSYEVVWTRILQVFLRNSPYTFTVILASFLIGITFNSMIAARIAKGYP